MLDSYIDHEREAFLHTLDTEAMNAQKTDPEYEAYWEAEYKARVAAATAKALDILKELETEDGFKAVLGLTTDEVIARFDAVSDYLLMLHSGIVGDDEEESEFNTAKYSAFLNHKIELIRLVTRGRGIEPKEAYSRTLENARTALRTSRANRTDTVFLDVSERVKGEWEGLELFILMVSPLA